MSVQYAVKCAICHACASLDDGDSWGALYSCGHVFHEDCIAKALEFKKECPICRAPARRPERDKNAQQHRIYLPLVVQSTLDLTQGPDKVATPGHLVVTSGEYAAKISEAEDLRKEVRDLQVSLKEEARKSEAMSAALHEESKKLRMKELEADELRDKAEEERLRLAEDVLVKERELTKLREEKHTLKSRLEDQANFYKGKAAREEREKNQHLKENARLELLLHKQLGSKDLSAIAKKLGATSKEDDATIAFQRALQLRNEEYRQLLLQKKKLDSDRRDLTAKLAEQRKEIHQLKMERVDLKARAANATMTPAQQQQPQANRGSNTPIPYNTPEEDMFPLRLPVHLPAGAAVGRQGTSAQPSAAAADGRTRPHTHKSSSGGDFDCTDDPEVLLDLGDEDGPDALLAAEFATRRLAVAGDVDRSSTGEPAASTKGCEWLQAAQPGMPADNVSCGIQPVQLARSAAAGPSEGGELEEVQCSIQDDSPDVEACPMWDDEEERQLLEQWEGTAVDVSVSVAEIDALLADGRADAQASQAGSAAGARHACHSDRPSRPELPASRLGTGASAGRAAGTDAAPAATAEPREASRAGKENLWPRGRAEHMLGVRLARGCTAGGPGSSAGLNAGDTGVYTQESSRQPPARKRLKRLYSPDPASGDVDVGARAERGADGSRAESEEVIDLGCDEDDVPTAVVDWCEDSQPPCDVGTLRLAPDVSFREAASAQDVSDGAGVRSNVRGSYQQLSGDSLGTSSLHRTQDSGSSRWKQSLNHVSSNLGAGAVKGRASFLHKKPGFSSGGTSGQFVCRGADGKGGKTTVLKAGSLHHSGMKRTMWPTMSQLGSAALRGDSAKKKRPDKARTAGTASIANFFKGPKAG
ncbi:hypothetical protein COCOBI_08-4210 [Coccomyxa sp. Obi]|nr:hypothetical protein COCOBI_08-4210 [Coccomyxa sp. Obi]